ncbi:hypothetical protein HDU93_007468 [Gonapodya sp. JEL0774]|nr:hypothetical protein HDU93_007468 [Gonapodya sp. JEL0774]
MSSGATSGGGGGSSGASSREKTSGAATEGLELEEAPLLAVVVADSFNNRFRPISFEKPRALLPLANVPLIEYTLEFLALNGIQEVYIICCAHADQISSYLSGIPRVHVIQAQQLFSVGDALREVDRRQGLVKADFVLVHCADLVGNWDLKGAVESHKKRRLVDKNLIMTMCVAPHPAPTRSRPRGATPVYLIDSATSQCHHYASIPLFSPGTPGPYSKRSIVTLPASHFVVQPAAPYRPTTLALRTDLIDLGVDICSIDVPPLFTENFDYADVRDHFVRGVMLSEILGKNFGAFVVGEHGDSCVGTYGARVTSTGLYAGVSKDILTRLSYPIVPDANLVSGESYRHHRGNIYRPSPTRTPSTSTTAFSKGGPHRKTSLPSVSPVAEGSRKPHDVTLARTARLAANVIVGAGTSVGADTLIHDSVLGKNVSIGDGCVIEGSFLWDGCVVHDGSVVYKSILADGAVVERGTTVDRGCIFGPGTAVGPDVIVPAFTRLTKLTPKQQEMAMGGQLDDEESQQEAEKAPGELGTGWIFRMRYGEEEEIEEFDERNLIVDELGRNMYDLLASPSTPTSLPNPATVATTARGLRTSSQISTIDPTGYFSASSEDEGSEDSETESESESDDGSDDLDAPTAIVTTLPRRIRREILETISRAFVENHSVVDAHSELSTTKMAENTSWDEVRRVVVPRMVEEVLILHSRGGNEWERFVGKWGKLISLMVFNQSDWTEVIDLALNYISSAPVDAGTSSSSIASTTSTIPSTSRDRILLLLLKRLYDQSVLPEEVVMTWWARTAKEIGEGVGGWTDTKMRIRKSIAPFVTWLEEAEEDEDEEGEDEEDSEGGNEEEGSSEAED